MVVWCFSHLGCMLSHHRYIDIFPITPSVKCRWLESKIRAVMLAEVNLPRLGFKKCWCGTIITTFAQFPGRSSQDHRPFSLVLAASRLWGQMHVVGSVKHERPSLQQMAKWRESARCCPLKPSRCFTMMFMVSLKIFSPSLSPLVIVSCSRVCLLVVSRLLGLTLRLFAPVCSCHRDSLTRWARSRSCAVLFFPVFSIGLCTWWHVSGGFLAAYEKGLFTRCWNLEVLHPSLNCFCHFPPFLTSCTHFRPKIRDTLERARNVILLGALSVPSRMGGERIIRASLTLIRVVVFVSCTYVVTFKPLPHLASPWLLLSLLLKFLCQAGYVNGNPSGSRLGSRSKRPSWRSGSSSAATLPTNNMLRISLCSTALTTLTTYVKIILQLPDHRDSPILLFGNLRGLKIGPTFWERIEAPLPPLRPRPKCNFIHPRQLSPFSWTLELPFSNDEILCGSKVLSSQEQINLLRGLRWALTRSWYSKWLIFRELPQIFAKHQKGGLLHLLRQPVPTNILLLDHLCRRDSASTTGTLGSDAEKKMPSRNRLQSGGTSLHCRRRLTMSIVTFLQVGSTWPIMQAVRFSSIRTPSIPTSMSNLSTFMTPRRDLPDQVMEGETGMGYARCSFTCLISSTTSQRSGSLYGVVSAYQQHLRQEAHSHSSCHHGFSKHWFGCRWFQWFQMVLHGGIAAETTSVPLTKLLLTVPYLRHRAPHRCGDPDRFRRIGQTSVDFLNHRVLIDFGKCACMVHSPSHEVHSACYRLIKVAFMKHGFIWISSTGATGGPSKTTLIGTSPSKNDLQIFHTGLQNDVLAKSWATIRSRRNCATTCTFLFPVT